MQRERGTLAARFVSTFALLVAAALFLWAVVLVLGTPVYGAPDRGDFYRVADLAGVRVPSVDPRHPVVHRDYALTERTAFDRTTTTAALCAGVARPFRVLFGEDVDRFELRQLGFVYLVLAAAVLGGAAIAGVTSTVVLLLTWSLLDPTRLAYFNAFSTETPELIGIVGLTAAFVALDPCARRIRRPMTKAERALSAVLFALVTLAVGFSRAPAALVPLTVVGVVAGRFSRFAGRSSTPNATRLFLGGALAATLVAAVPVVYFARGDVARFRSINAYHRVFLGIAVASRSPERTLDGLDIPATELPRVGTSYFDTRVPDELQRTLAGVSSTRVAASYLSEPAALAEALKRIGRSLARERNPGAYDAPPPAHRERLSGAQSNVHDAAFGALPPLVWLVAFAGLGSAIFRREGPRSALIFLFATFATQLGIAVAGDGFYALGRHLIVARLTLDLIAVLVVWDLLRRPAERLASKLQNREAVS
ncbi:MAG TPA: hypothetical protein VH142_10230 [Polyangiaceae bacterium]|jgi:hypothetical protein|nr:hypothetical protein [Polyangiaceae bacterium]